MNHATEIPGGLLVALARDFGDVERWRAEFTALIWARHEAPGHAVLMWRGEEARLVNQWIGQGAPPTRGCVLLLARGESDASTAVDWMEVTARYVEAVRAHAEAFGLGAAELAARRAEFDVIDVRRDAPFDASAETIEGAGRADPQHLAVWAGRLDPARKVVVYCVHGHEVGQGSAALLRLRGIDARWLEGGFEQWKQEGRRLQPKQLREGATP